MKYFRVHHCCFFYFQAPEGENQPSTEVDLFISTEKIMVLNTDLKVSTAVGNLEYQRKSFRLQRAIFWIRYKYFDCGLLLKFWIYLLSTLWFSVISKVELFDLKVYRHISLNLKQHFSVHTFHLNFVLEVFLDPLNKIYYRRLTCSI